MMKTKIFVGMVVLCLCLGVEAKQKKPKTANPAQEIRTLLDKQVAAWNRGDLEGFMAAYWKAPELSFYSGGTKTHGWQQTIDRYRNRYQSEGREMGQLNFSDLEIEILSPVSAFVRGHWQLKMKDGEPGGLFTLVFRKLQNGWNIVHDHTSSQ
jgi:beta-aspartyl-peptidase (threonine type)